MGGTIIVAGDVGGTKTYLAAYQPTEHAFKPLAEKRYTTRDFADISSLLAAFVAESGHQPQRVVLGVPGPVRQLPVRAVNLPWLIDPEHIKSHLGIDEVYLLNDLQATSYGTLVLEEDDLCILNEGETDSEGNIAVIAAGTGLGEGGLVWAGGTLCLRRFRGRTLDLCTGLRLRGRTLALSQRQIRPRQLGARRLWPRPDIGL